MRRLLVTLGFAIFLCFVGAGLPAEEVMAPSPGEIERFDVKKGAVTARAPHTPELQEETAKLLDSIGQAQGLVRADPKDGTVLRIPLRPSLEVRKPGFYAFATEVFLFLPKAKSPYILIFSEENEPRLFAVSHPVKRLLQLCGWEDALD